MFADGVQFEQSPLQYLFMMCMLGKPLSCTLQLVVTGQS